MLFSPLEAVVAWVAALGWPTSTVVPPSPPAEFVTVQAIGGMVSDKVAHPSFAVQAWAGTDARAEEMARTILLAALTQAPPPGIHAFYGVSEPYPFYDESTRCPRYQLTLDASAQLEI